jgi:hypothetical protein
MLPLGENLNCARFLGCIVYVVLLISWSSRGRLAHTPTTPKKKHKNKRKARGRAPGNGEQYCTQVENSRRGSRPRQNLAALTLARGLRPEPRSRLPSKTTLLGDPLACQTAKEGGRTSVLIVMASFADVDVPSLPALAYGNGPPGTRLLKPPGREVVKKRHP